MVDKTISHYRIIEKLGEGGMGVIYKAQDTKLDRPVALKFLPPAFATDSTTKERFILEAKSASALQHNNICTIHEINETDDGQMYIVMDYYQGITLKDKILVEDGGATGPVALTIDKSIDYTIQIAQGLQKAHEKGIIHRDIKPANIIITNDDEAKILDFGLAKFRGQTKITKTGRTLGTVAYMSPEQARGEEVDHRTDIWSLGVMLYEMITGELPFKGDYDQAIIYSILNSDPEPLQKLAPETSAKLIICINRLIEKNKAKRYQSCNEFLTDIYQIRSNLDETKTNEVTRFKIRPLIKHKYAILTSITILAVLISLLIYSSHTERNIEISPLKRLVVLPFENLGSIDDEYFADGMTEEITSRLSVLHGLGVISRSSAIQYKDTKKTISQIGEELDVDYVLEGTVRWDKSTDDRGRVIVTPQLIRVADDIHLWSKSYDRLLENIFNIQTTIAEEVIKSLDIAVLEPEREELYRHPTNNLEAYDLFIRAREIVNKYMWTDYPKLEQAVQLFEQAIEKDENLVMAYVRISDIHSWLYHVQFDYSEQRQAKSKTAIDKALEMEPDLPEAKLRLANYYYRVFRDYNRARELFNEVKKQRPNVPPELIAGIERRQGNMTSSVHLFEEVFKLDPRQPAWAQEVASTYNFTRQYGLAESWYYRNQILVPGDDRSKGLLARNYLLASGNINAAQSALSSIKKINSNTREPLETIILVDLIKNNFHSALNRYDSLSIDYIKDMHYFMDKFSVKAYVYYILGDTLKTRLYADSSIVIINNKVKEDPIDPRYYSALGIAQALRGKKNEAIIAAKRAIELYPISLDALHGQNYVYNLAWVYTITGNIDEAINQLAYLLSIPAGYFVSKAMLKIDPKWNPLRNISEFQKLIE